MYNIFLKHLEKLCSACVVDVYSVARTPVSSVVVQRRSKSYRQSYRSYVGTMSHLGYTPGFTKRRLTTSRLAPKRRSVAVRNEHYYYHFYFDYFKF